MHACSVVQGAQSCLTLCDPIEGNGTPLQYSCLENPMDGGALVGCSPWGRSESDTTERLHFHFLLSCIGEGNGNPLQCSCLENPMDGGAWWAAIYGVTQSWTRLKLLSSSSRLYLSRLLLSMEFSRQEYRNGLLPPPPGEFSQPNDQTHISGNSRQNLYCYATREAWQTITHWHKTTAGRIFCINR